MWRIGLMVLTLPLAACDPDGMSSSDPARTLVDVTSGQPVPLVIYEPEETRDNGAACQRALALHNAAFPERRYSCEMGAERFRSPR